MKETTIKLLQREDQSFEQDHFDFDFLRREGLKHIGDLSGKIWTDHNVHDPGITILEMLSYALMDLGYRTRLPIQDLLASPNNSADDSYFTPAQILGNNPTTILDYRRLLIAIEGVRNAWLMADRSQEYRITYKEDEVDLCKKYRIDCPPFELTTDESSNFSLNGLYSVLIQKEPGFPASDVAALIKKVQDKLHEHRNLCEDFVEVKVLCEEKIGVCVDIEITANYDPESVYVKVILELEKMLSPRIPFYTLQEMLEERGKLIEEIFEGRPFDPDYNSPGFIDVDELKNSKLRKEIHLSDFYSLLNAIDGVDAVQNIKLSGFTDQGSHDLADVKGCKEWVFNLANNHVPVFSLDHSCITLSKDGAIFKLDPFEIQRIKSKYLGTGITGQARGNKSYLDIAIPNGNYRPDLGEYYSIQNEFPAVYGIGEGGLPDSATKKRKAEAIQLKGYLLFFDQLLVNYLGKLSTARELFAFKNNGSHNILNTNLDSVPDLENLLQFYNKSNQEKVALIPIAIDDFTQGIRDDLALKSPLEYNFNNLTFSVTNKLRRDVEVEQLAREISQEHYSILTYPTENCFYFVIKPNSLSTVLFARAVYASEEEARIAANNISFVGAQKENYTPVNLPATQKYGFELLFSPSTNTSLVDELTETKQSKLDKRNLFLDHLLARFSESFTNYSLLLFEQEKNRELASQQLVDNKVNFLSNYPNLSSNRGKAFNYKNQTHIWGGDNISGLEKRLLALTGQEDWQKKYLCNFEVHQYGPEYQVEFKYRNKTIFKTKNVYDEEEKAKRICALILQEAMDNDFYIKEDTKDCYFIKFNGSILLEPLKFENREERDLCFNSIRNLFHKKAAKDGVNVYASHALYYQELKDRKGTVVAQSKTSYETAEIAIAKESDFIKKIKEQTPKGTIDLTKLKLRSKTIEGKKIILDGNFISPIVKVADSEYRWQINGIDGEAILLGKQYFSNQENAFRDYLYTVFERGTIWQQTEGEIKLIANNGKVLAEQAISSEAEGEIIKTQADQLLNAESVTKQYLKEREASYGFELRNAANRTLLESAGLYENRNLIANQLESFDVGRYKMIPVDKTHFSISFLDEKGNVIANTREPISDTEGHLKQIASNISELKTVKYLRSFTFSIKENSEEILEGFTRYRTKAKAFGALFSFLTEYKKERLSFKEIRESDIELADIELFMIDEQGQFKAFSPKENFRKPEYWENETKVIQKILKDFDIPFSYLSESRFYLCDENEKALLSSKGYYASPNTARSAAWQAIFVLSQLDHIGEYITIDKEEDTYGLSVNDQDIQLFSPWCQDRSELEGQIELFQQGILQQSYSVTPTPIPDKWKHQFYWLDEEGTASLLYQSKEDYGTLEEACAAYEIFLSSTTQLAIEPTDDGQQYGFQILADGQILEHPKSYEDKAKRDEIILGIRRMFAFFDIPQSDQDCVFLTDRSNDEKSFVYRLFKKGNPIAYHPCECYDLENSTVDLIDYRSRQDLLCERQYDYADFCLNGSKVVCQIDGQYHYVLRDKHTLDIYFTSKKSFASKSEAFVAFQEEYLTLIHLASKSNNYLTAALPDGTLIYCLGKSIDKAIASMTATVFQNGENMAKFFYSFPIRLKADRLGEKCYEDEITGFYFHLLGSDQDCDFDWLSTACYESPSEAWKDFRKFFNLLKNKVNYRPILKPYLNIWRLKEDEEEKKSGKEVINIQDGGLNDLQVNMPDPNKDCCSYISISEVLVESCREYETEDCAWGKETVLATLSPDAFSSGEEACSVLDDLDFGRMSQNIKIKGKPSSRDKTLYYFEIPITVLIEGKEVTKYLIGTELFDEKTKAREEALKLINGLKVIPKVILDEDCLYRIALIRPFEEKPKVDLTCGDQKEPDCLTCLDENKGLERFLQAACYDEAFVPCLIGSGKKATYSFKIVEPENYCFANHPFQYHTAEDRDKMKEWMATNLISDNWSLVPVGPKNGPFHLQLCTGLITDDDTTDKDSIYFVNGDAKYQPFYLHWTTGELDVGEQFCLFETHLTFTLEELTGDLRKETLECYKSKFLRLLEEEEYLSPTGDFSEKYYGLKIINPNAILAEHPQTYTFQEDLWEAIAETKAHIHTEGMHLLEHILLRPERKVISNPGVPPIVDYDCTCTLPVMPDLNCSLPLPEDDLDPCLNRGGGHGADKVVPTYVPGLDPYSFLATTVFPYWSKRYKNANFKSFVTNTLLRETPAHVAINQLWLSPKQLCKFEDQYRKWLLYKADLSVCGGEMPCDLMDCLLELENYCPKPDSATEQDCDCTEGAVKANLTSLTLNSYFNNSKNDLSPLLDNKLRYFPVQGNQVVFNQETWKELLKGKIEINDLELSESEIISEIPVVKVVEEKDKQVLKKEVSPKEVAKKVEKTNAKPTIKKAEQKPTEKPKKETAKSRAVSKNKKPVSKKVKAKVKEKQVVARPFLANIKAIKDANVLRSKTYANTLAYAENIASEKLTKQSITALSDQVVAYALRYAIGKKGGGDDKVYIDIMANAIALTLDKLCAQDKTKAQLKKELSDVIAKIKAKELPMSIFKKVWNVKALQNNLGEVPAIDEYLKLFKV